MPPAAADDAPFDPDQYEHVHDTERYSLDRPDYEFWLMLPSDTGPPGLDDMVAQLVGVSLARRTRQSLAIFRCITQGRGSDASVWLYDLA